MMKYPAKTSSPLPSLAKKSAELPAKRLSEMNNPGIWEVMLLDFMDFGTPWFVFLNDAKLNQTKFACKCICKACTNFMFQKGILQHAILVGFFGQLNEMLYFRLRVADAFWFSQIIHLN